MQYTGGKNGSGVYQSIINLMPKHYVYIEAFLGSGAILRNKKAAVRNIGVELDEKVLMSLWRGSDFELYNESFFDFLILDNFHFHFNNRKTLIYADPPYLKSVRSSKNKLYNFEMMSEAEHFELLTKLKSLDCNVMISGYDCDFYNEHLNGWRKSHFWTTNRAGSRVEETVWLNFPEPFELHDYQFLGDDYRQRERIKKKRKRLKQRLLKMDKFERLALMATVEEIKNSAADRNTVFGDVR